MLRERRKNELCHAVCFESAIAPACPFRLPAAWLASLETVAGAHRQTQLPLVL